MLKCLPKVLKRNSGEIKTSLTEIRCLTEVEDDRQVATVQAVDMKEREAVVMLEVWQPLKNEYSHVDANAFLWSSQATYHWLCDSSDQMFERANMYSPYFLIRWKIRNLNVGEQDQVIHEKPVRGVEKPNRVREGMVDPAQCLISRSWKPNLVVQNQNKVSYFLFCIK